MVLCEAESAPYVKERENTQVLPARGGQAAEELRLNKEEGLRT